MRDREMTAGEAGAVYDVLVSVCGASTEPDDRLDFISLQAREVCPEWRFQGDLGYGGKFWRSAGRWYVDCYPEDSSPDSRKIIDEANWQLAALLEKSTSDS